MKDTGKDLEQQTYLLLQGPNHGVRLYRVSLSPIANGGCNSITGLLKSWKIMHKELT